MFTDLEGSTAMTTALGDRKSMHLLHIHNAITRAVIKDHNGREIKHTGHGFMVSFVTADDGTRCAASMQKAFAAHSAESPAQEMHVRIGLSAGEPVEENNDLFGSTAQMAARVCSSALPDQILAVESVIDNCNLRRREFVPVGEKIFKGFNEPTHLFEIPWR